jgi:hypothetical protein
MFRDCLGLDRGNKVNGIKAYMAGQWMRKDDDTVQYRFQPMCVPNSSLSRQTLYRFLARTSLDKVCWLPRKLTGGLRYYVRLC